MAEQVEVVKAKCNWNFFIFLGLIIIGILFIALYAITGNETTEELLVVEEHSAIVEDQIGEFPYLTLNVKCYYCDDQKYGKQWNKLIKHETCKKTLFSNCFINFTSVQQTTKVINLVQNCKKDCRCKDQKGWCTPKDKSCDMKIKCCQGDVICPVR